MYAGAGFVLFVLLGALPAFVNAHANVTSPPIRSPGNAFLQACGQTSFNTVSGDPTGHIEEQEPVTAGCQLTLCRGMLFADQPASNVQQVTPGDSMNLAVDCTIPHGGPANVSLVDTTGGGDGVVIGAALASFSNFCPTTGGTPANQSNIAITLPDAATIGSSCQTAGDCVLQLFWATPDFSQNYYYCVDLAMTTVVTSTAAQTTTTAASTTSAATTSIASGFSTIVVSSTTVPAASNTTTLSPAKQSSAAVRNRGLRPRWIRRFL